MATAKIQTVKGLRVEIFSRTLRKKTTRPLTVWIVGTDVERGIAFRNWVWYNFPQYKPINRNLQNYKERIHIMEGRLIAFVIWVIIGVLFIVMGIYDFNSKKAKPFGFWANAEVAPIEDLKGYNRALGILWCVYGVLFTLIGLPLLDGQNSGLIIIPILGAMLISIAAMVAYVVGIEPKYRKKK